MKETVFTERAITKGENPTVVYGHSYEVSSCYQKKTMMLSATNSKDNITGVENTDLSGRTIQPETISICTGQFDSKGKIIYTNDVFVINKAVHGIVRFGQYKCDGVMHLGFYIEWGKGQDFRPDLLFWKEHGYVYGTIHDTVYGGKSYGNSNEQCCTK